MKYKYKGNDELSSLEYTRDSIQKDISEEKKGAFDNIFIKVLLHELYKCERDLFRIEQNLIRDKIKFRKASKIMEEMNYYDNKIKICEKNIERFEISIASQDDDITRNEKDIRRYQFIIASRKEAQERLNELIKAEQALIVVFESKQAKI